MAAFPPSVPIVQFSPIRSGSTLVYNILRDVFPGRYIVKEHNYIADYDRLPVVTTVRDPVACVVSSIKRYGIEQISRRTLDEQIRELKENGADDIEGAANRPNVLLLRYEEFRFDFDPIFDGLEQHFGVQIPPPQRARLERELHIDRIARFTERFRDFRQHDETTHWHGRHVSEFKGAINYYWSVLTAEQIEYVRSHFVLYSELFGYEL